jgi:hypothetical protein
MDDNCEHTLIPLKKILEEKGWIVNASAVDWDYGSFAAVDCICAPGGRRAAQL